MKKAALLLILVLLTGCSQKNESLDSAMELRSRLLSGGGCSFNAHITADYGDELYEFTLICQGDPNGGLEFSVAQPESISGITGKISEAGGALTFADTSLEFPLLADGQLSPVGAPWILLKTLRSGYLTSAGREEDLNHVVIHDSYEEDAMMLDIWLDANHLPVQADILWEGRRIVSISVENFQIL